MASRKDMLSKLKMPAKSAGAEEADLDLESLGLEDEEMMDEVPEEDADVDMEDLESPLADIEDDALLKEAEKRGLIPSSAEDDGEPVDEEGEEVDVEEDEDELDLY